MCTLIVGCKILTREPTIPLSLKKKSNLTILFSFPFPPSRLPAPGQAHHQLRPPVLQQQPKLERLQSWFCSTLAGRKHLDSEKQYQVQSSLPVLLGIFALQRKYFCKIFLGLQKYSRKKNLPSLSIMY